MTAADPTMSLLNIDLDNVLGDYSTSMHGYAEKQLSRTLPISNSWAIHEDWGIPKGLWLRLFRDGVRDGYIWGLDEPVIAGAQEGMWALSDAGYYLRIVTHRLTHTNDYDLAVRQTSEWLRKHNFPYRSLAVIGAEPKSNYHAQAIVDDGGHNIRAWNDAGMPNAVVFDQPWNQDVEEGEGIHRAYGWQHVVPLIKELVPL